MTSLLHKTEPNELDDALYYYCEKWSRGLQTFKMNVRWFDTEKKEKIVIVWVYDLVRHTSKK